jgi:pilus assembly protein CpaD
MTNRTLAQLTLCLALALAGCNHPESDWSEVETPKQLHVDFVRLHYTATFAAGSAELAPGEADRLASFLETAQVRPDDRVFFEGAPNDALAGSRIGTLTREVTRRGIAATTLPPGTMPSDQMMVSVERYVVSPPDCPNWTSPIYGDHSNRMNSNFGCATASNLSLMVADPRDLVIGRDLGPDDAQPSGAAVDRYRTGTVKKLSATGGFSAGGASSGGGQ